MGYDQRLLGDLQSLGRPREPSLSPLGLTGFQLVCWFGSSSVKNVLPLYYHAAVKWRVVVSGGFLLQIVATPLKLRGSQAPQQEGYRDRFSPGNADATPTKW